MSRSTIRNKLLIGAGGQTAPIATSCFVTPWVNVDEHRRISVTVGVGSATGAVGDLGGFTGIFSIEGTNELGQAAGATGGLSPGCGQQPGTNGYTGALYYQPVPSGTFNFSNAYTGQNALMFTIDGLGPAWVRAKFNQTASGTPYPGATACGSGTMNVFLTAKNG